MRLVEVVEQVSYCCVSYMVHKSSALLVVMMSAESAHAARTVHL